MNSTRKTLVVDARMIHASGIGTDLQNWLPYLKGYFKITLLGNPDELSQFSWARELHIIRFTKPIYSIGEQLMLPLVVPPCDYFFTPHFNVPVFSIRARKRLVLIHDVFHLASSAVGRIHKLYARFLLQSAIDRSDKVITISEFSRSEINKHLHVNGKQIHKIGLGVDHDLFNTTRDPNLMGLIADRYGLPQDFLLFVGNVKPHKNLKTLVLALYELKEAAYQDLKLVVVGKKEGFITGDNSIIDLIKHLQLQDRVIFTGYVETEHLPILYQLARLFVFPSLYEGYGLPPLEAMASGCPTIVSYAASMPEVCLDATLYFDGNKSSEIAELIRKVLSDEPVRQELIAKGLALTAQHTWQKSAEQLCSIFTEER